MTQEDQRRRRADAEALLRLPRWNDEEIDHAVALHDLLLESPDGESDRVAAALRKRLTLALRQRSRDIIDLTRAQYFAAGWLDSPDPFQRRLSDLHYLGLSSYLGLQAGVPGLLDRAIGFLLELDRVVQESGTTARDLLGERYDTAMINLAAACYLRYDGRRELLVLQPPPEVEHEIRADLEQAVEVGERLLRDSSHRAEVLGLLGSCYARRYEDDERYKNQRTIDLAIAWLQQAVDLAGTGSSPAEMANRIGLTDKVAGALLARDTLRDVDTAIELLTAIRAEAQAFFPLYNAAGGALTTATARLHRWMHTRSPEDRESARQAYLDGFSAAVDVHLPTAIDLATQWGGWARGEGWWAEAGEAYGRAMRVLHLAVRRQASREERAFILLKATGVAAMAAFALARSGAADDALVALETGQAVLLAEAFDRRSFDYDRIAAVAGPRKADRYQFLTTEMTRLEALLLAADPARADPARASEVAAGLEALRSERFALTESLGPGVTAALADLQRPPILAELCDAAGDTPVVYLAATPDGGLALIVRSGAVEPVELPGLTGRTADELAAALDQAVLTGNPIQCDQVCEELWDLVMSRVTPALDGEAHAIVIPGGPLATLPWHAASIPGRPAGYVLDRLAISYMPNIRSVPRARAAGADMTAPLRVLAIEQPVPTSMPPLPSVDAEIAAVCSCHSDRFQVTRLPGTGATADAVREALSRFQVIHFAGHAEADPGDPLASAMIMADDERLTVGDMLARDIGMARFAVLSACATARAEDPLSDELVNFPTALLQCGLSGVVGTLWTSHDRASSVLMDAFYQEWQGSRVPPAEALRRAQQRIRASRFASPLFWANFVYVGP